jgi:hypothetical protein
MNTDFDHCFGGLRINCVLNVNPLDQDSSSLYMDEPKLDHLVRGESHAIELLLSNLPHTS